MLLLSEKNWGPVRLVKLIGAKEIRTFLEFENCRTLKSSSTKLGRNLIKNNSNSTTAMSFLFTNRIRTLYLQS